MSYLTNYLQASELADMIIEGKLQKVSDTRSEGVRQEHGLVSRRQESAPPEPKPYSVADSIVEMMAKMRQNKEPLGEGSVTGAAQAKSMPARSQSAPPSRQIPKGYPVSPVEIEKIIREEASLRNMDPEVAVQIYRHEGRGAYQSQIAREGKGSLGGLEASFGPYQLYTGGGLGNEYEEVTGRKLTEDNTEEGITTQIRFALDKAAELGWGPWYGRKPAGISERQGLENASPLFNWRD